MALFKLAVILGVATLTTAINTNISSPPLTNWGFWPDDFDRCPNGRHAQGFQLKTEPNQWLNDDTALNAIRLFCGDPFRPDTAVITSTEGDFGAWGHVYTCYPAVLTGFQLRVESDQGSGDNTATNNARFTCSDNPNDYIQGDGLAWGEWTEPQYCRTGQAICGIAVQMEPFLGASRDDTMLNNVRLECCDYHRSDLQEGYEYIEKNGAYPQAISTEFAELLRKAVADEMNNATDPNNFAKLKLAKLIRGKVGVRSSPQLIENTESQAQKENLPVLVRVSEALKKIQSTENAKKSTEGHVSVFAKLTEALKKAESTQNAEKQSSETRVSVFSKLAQDLKRLQSAQNTESQFAPNDHVSVFDKKVEVVKKPTESK